MTKQQLENQIITQALTIIENRLKKPGAVVKSPDTANQFLKIRLAEKEHEVFSVLFVDNRHRIIEYEEMFRGTINGASVHIREIAKRALALNAAAVVLAHNHPSGVSEPSEADRSLTRKISEALRIFDIRTLDHIIVGGVDTMSFAQRGYL